MTLQNRLVVACAWALAAWMPPAGAQEQPPRYSAKVPPSITTPDRAETALLGTLSFRDGMPSAETAEKALDFLTVSRGVEAFLSGLSATSIQGMMDGYKSIGVNPGDLVITRFMDARMLFLTPNTSTVYGSAELNVADGPIVLVIPPRVLGPVMDGMMHYITDVGFVGPDQGKGGRYLFVRADYEGPIPDGYFVIRTPSNRNLLFFRFFIEGGNVDAAVESARRDFNIYPLALAGKAPPVRVVDATGVQFNTIFSNDFSYFEELNRVVQNEPAGLFDPQLYGTFAAIGIRKGQPFEPDARTRKLLTDAVAIGNAYARAITFAPRDAEQLRVWPDRQYFDWKGGWDFMEDGALSLDDRTRWYYSVTGHSESMVTPQVGAGSVYPYFTRDVNGDYLDGGRTYSLTMPGPVPARNFWAFTVYDNQTRSLLETDQRSAGIDSNREGLTPNPDGSYTVWFGPKPPEGREGNWVQTWPGRGYFVIMRLFGPLEPWFDQSWRPGDAVPVDE